MNTNYRSMSNVGSTVIFVCQAKMWNFPYLLLIQEPHHESAAPVGTSADEENENNIFPYLLVNIGSGVSMIEVCQYTDILSINHILQKSAVTHKRALKNVITATHFYEQVIGKGKFERIIGSHLGGGTILGLARLLTGCSRYYPIIRFSFDYIVNLFFLLLKQRCASLLPV